MKVKNRKFILEFNELQLKTLINLVDKTIDSVNIEKRDPLGLGIDEYINLVYHLESVLDENEKVY
jgi:hypothetical protein